MIGFKIILFLLTIITVKYIFININDIGDKKIQRMKELIDFTDYLRIYSCDMKMSFEEILDKYIFKSNETKKICYRLLDELKIQDKLNKNNFIFFINLSLLTPNDFNNIFSEIIDYYGNTFSDVLNKKLSLTIKEMETTMKEFEEIHKEKKNLYNRVSLLFGCLAAVILI